jgi:hypothetical protein
MATHSPRQNNMAVIVSSFQPEPRLDGAITHEGNYLTQGNPHPDFDTIRETPNPDKPVTYSVAG